MPRNPEAQLSRRERQIMDVVYRRGEASVADVIEDLPDAPSYSAVRALLRILEGKGYLKHKQQGARYIYLPKRSRRQASRSALERVVGTFFEGSVEKAVAALLDGSASQLSDEELDRLSRLIDEAKQQGR